MMGNGNYGYGGGAGWLGFGFGTMMLFGAIVLVGIVMLVVWAVRRPSGHVGAAAGTIPPSGGAGHDEAVAIAKRRLATGEIDKDQYDAIMKAMSS
jgi:uncharacterized membrane protein